MRQTRTAAELKLMIEEELCRDHPECERAEVIIIPYVDGLTWGASLFGSGPTFDEECRSRVDDIVVQLRVKFDLA